MLSHESICRLSIIGLFEIFRRCSGSAGIFLLALLLNTGMSAGVEAAVGRVAGDFAVSGTGAATYAIPIAVPPGANGLQPQISLVYNSQGGASVVGQGWGLAGFSSITRCGLTQAVDGRFRGVRFDGDDRFCLDGQPLILAPGNSYPASYGANGAQYRTELHGYERITSYGSYGANSPGYFEVELPDGRKMRFGNDADSKIDTPAGNGEVRAWLLNEVIDKYDNRILFSYHEDIENGEWNPAEIIWSANPTQGTTGRYKLIFEYGDRATECGGVCDDVRSGYTYGMRWLRSERLETIRYQYDSSDVQTYSLRYGVTDGTRRSRLESVTQCGYSSGASECLPATVIEWQNAVSGWMGDYGAGQTVSGFDQAVFGDFDGDGARDIIFPAQDGNWQVLPSFAGFYSSAVKDTGEPANNRPGTPLDYNGDGYTDIMTVRTGPNGATWHVLQSNGSRTNPRFSDRETGIPADEFNTPSILDMNGDGLDDVLYPCGTGSVCFYLNNGAQSGNETAYPTRQIQALPLDVASECRWQADSLRRMDGTTQVGDFDGDGRQDLLLLRGISCPYIGNVASWQAYLSTGDGFESDYMGVIASDSGVVTVLDINGDGLSDIASVTQTVWKTTISQGDHFASMVSSGISGGTDPTLLSAAVDFNGDGYQDLVLPYPAGNQYRVYLSDGGGLSVDRYESLNIQNPTDVARFSGVDTSGDGTTDLVFARSDTGQWRVNQHQSGADLVKKITDGLGNYFSPSYSWLNSNYFSQYAVTAAPDAPGTRIFQGPLHVVVAYQVSDGQEPGGHYTFSYQYANGRLDTTGRGFLGFETIAVTDSRTNIRTETAFDHQFPNIGRTLFRRAFRDNGQGPKISDYAANWGVSETGLSNGDPAGSYWHVYLDDGVTKSYELDGSLVSTVTQDARSFDAGHGISKVQVTEITTPASSAGSYTTTRTLTLDEGARSAGYCLGLPIRTEIRQSNPDTGSSTRVVSQVNHATRCHVSEQTVDPGGPAPLRTTFSFDGFGNSDVISYGDIAGVELTRKTDLTYDADGYRPLTERKLVSRTAGSCGGAAIENWNAVKYTWDHAMGVQRTITGVEGLTTEFTYDAFGRLTRSASLDDGTYTNISYQSCSNFCPAGSAYQVVNQNSNGLWSKRVLDSYDRETGAVSRLLDGSESRQVTDYDAAGRVDRQSLPYLAGDSPYWIDNSYDLLGRLTQQNQPVDESIPDGAWIRWAYDGLRTTVTRENSGATGDQVTTFVYDPTSSLARVIDSAGGVSEYSYTSFGELKTVSDPAGNIRTFGYDSRGFRVSVDDPDSGSWSYDYNVFGELVGQTDDRPSPGKNTIWFTYNGVGQITTRRDKTNGITAGTTNWSYYTAGQGSRGRLNRVTGPEAGFAESYTYDLLGLLTRTKTTIDGVQYDTDRTYNVQGQLDTMTYPVTVDGYRPVFQYIYNGTGYVSGVRDGITGELIYFVNHVDALGRSTQAYMGNYFDTWIPEVYSYDRANTRLKSIRTENGTIQDYTYQWDQAGNLTQRHDAAQSITEVFTYDALNRLRTASLNGAETLSLSYAPDGNILSKSDVGSTYDYSGSSGPHAVDRISGGPRGVMSFSYDANGNMTSHNGEAVTWTPYNKPKQINAGNRSAAFSYGPDRQRIRQIEDNSRTHHYVGPHFEVEMNGDSVAYRSNVLFGGRVIYSQRAQTNPADLQAYYLHRDHQGNVDRLSLVSGSFTGETEHSFDVFGKRRNTDWSADPSDLRADDDYWTGRGYTGHEHLDGVGLIHMNGRVQDPVIGRMLSPDSVLGELTDPQSMNAYSYVSNNPASLADPSGFCGVITGGDRDNTIVSPCVVDDFDFGLDSDPTDWGGVAWWDLAWQAESQPIVDAFAQYGVNWYHGKGINEILDEVALSQVPALAKFFGQVGRYYIADLTKRGDAKSIAFMDALGISPAASGASSPGTRDAFSPGAAVSVGIDLVVGGLGNPTDAQFFGGGVEAGITSFGQLYASAYFKVGAGVGAIAAVGATAGGSLLLGSLQAGEFISSTDYRLEGAAAWGIYGGGFSASGAPGSLGIGSNLRFASGYGVYGAGMAYHKVTYATPALVNPWLSLSRWLSPDFPANYASY